MEKRDSRKERGERRREKEREGEKRREKEREGKTRKEEAVKRNVIKMRKDSPQLFEKNLFLNTRAKSLIP